MFNTGGCATPSIQNFMYCTLFAVFAVAESVTGEDVIAPGAGVTNLTPKFVGGCGGGGGGVVVLFVTAKFSLVL